jgi:hypothetical protein
MNMATQKENFEDLDPIKSPFFDGSITIDVTPAR